MFVVALPFLLPLSICLHVRNRISVHETICDPPICFPECPFNINTSAFSIAIVTKVCTYLVQDSNPQAVWSMDPSFDISFAALSGRFDGTLQLWDVREDEPVKSFLVNVLIQSCLK